MRRRARLPLLAVTAAWVVASQSTGSEELLLLSGACDHLDFLNGLMFRREGHTASGAPYFKAENKHGPDQYLYWDPRCYNGPADIPRWIIDPDKPSLTAANDLDGDGGCVYHGRINHEDSTHPPLYGTWHLMCGGVWKDQLMIFTYMTTTGTVTATSSTTTTSVSTTTTTASTTTATSTVSTTTSTTATATTTTTTSATSTATTTTSTTSTATTTTSTATITTSATSTATITSATSTATATTSTKTFTTSATSTTKSTTTPTETSTTTTVSSTTTSTYATTAATTHATATHLDSTSTTGIATSVVHADSVASLATTLPGTTTTTPNATEALTTSSAALAVVATSTEAVDFMSFLNISGGCCPCCPAGPGVACCEGSTQGERGPCCEDTSDVEANVTTTMVASVAGAGNSTPTTSSAATTGTSGAAVVPTSPATSTLEPSSPQPAPAPQPAPQPTPQPTPGPAQPAAPQALLLSSPCQDLPPSLSFSLRGYAAGGAPFYASNRGFYIYYDRDCKGSGTGSQPRWIIDADAPDVTRLSDLDGDGKCSYFARLNSADASRPPASGMWHFFCRGAWTSLSMDLQEATGPIPPLEVIPVTTPPSPSVALEIHGACDLQQHLNGPLLLKGTTASGAPYYRSLSGGYYLYFDPDCDDGPSGVPRWIIDTDAPNTSLARDLDGDRECRYEARTNSRSLRPPSEATWLMYCRGGWEELSLRLEEISPNVTLSTKPGSAAISGSCRCDVVAHLLTVAFAVLALGQVREIH